MDIEGNIYRIITGHYYISVDNTDYRVVSPNIQIKQKAHYIYNNILNSNKFDTKYWLKKKQADRILETNGIWNSTKEESLKVLNNRLDDMKIELYLKYDDPTMRKKIKASLSTGRIKINELETKKTSMDTLTLEYYANSAKNEYIVLNTVYKDEELVFKGKDDTSINTDFLDSIITEVNRNGLSMEDLRIVARSDLWKSYWDAAKGNIFAPPAYAWNDEQRLLVNLSKMYDSVHEHPEAPDDKVIADDDALDGWMLATRRKAEKERKKTKLMDSIGGKYKNAGEIFIVTQSQEEAKGIYGLNDAEGMAEVNHLKTIAKTSPEPVQWQDMPHVRTKLESQLKQRNAMKKGE